MIRNGEKAVIHKYARYAGLTRLEYVDLVRSATGKTSSADPRFSHADVDRVMAAIEAVLWQRIDEGLVRDPGGIERYHWRSRLPRQGMTNTRLRYKLERYWGMLRDYLPQDDRTDDYLARLIRKASGADVRLDAGGIAWQSVPGEAVRLAIEAVKDRLHHTVRSAA